jgi:hypothetical protein
MGSPDFGDSCPTAGPLLHFINQARNSNTWKVIYALDCLNLEIVTLAKARCARLTSHVVPAGLRCSRIAPGTSCPHSVALNLCHMEFQMYVIKTYARHGVHLLSFLFVCLFVPFLTLFHF